MKAVLLGAVLLVSGCSHFKATLEVLPDGKTQVRVIERWSCMEMNGWKTAEIEGLGKVTGYSNDGGKGSLSEVGGIVGQATEGAVRGALKSQGK